MQTKRASKSPEKKKFIWARSIATPAQRMADTAHGLIFLPVFIQFGLLFYGSIAISRPLSEPETITLFEMFGMPAVIIMILFGWLGLLISSTVLTSHMRKQDGKVNAPIFPGLYLIWSIVLYVFALAKTNDDVAQAGILSKAATTVAPTAFGWLYIMCCIGSCGLVIFLTVLYFKLLKNEGAHRNP